ncbi:MAG TPA: hypothetical protein VLA78_01970 [Paracoccaceae bacterium]|nr:hypothetical protein [Paracoccaceae bacterium]
MTPTRRRVLALAALGAAALAFPPAHRAYLGHAADARVRDVVRAAFGAPVADDPAVAAFFDDIEAASAGGAMPEDLLVQLFATSTNVVRHAETTEPLWYGGLFLPYRSPCANQLGAAYGA